MKSVPYDEIVVDLKAWGAIVPMTDAAMLRRRRRHGASARLPEGVHPEDDVWDAGAFYRRVAQRVADRWATRRGYVASTARARLLRDVVTDRPQLIIRCRMVEAVDSMVTRASLDSAIARKTHRLHVLRLRQPLARTAPLR